MIIMLQWKRAVRPLALHLAGETKPRGAHLENLVLADLLAWRDVHPVRLEVLYWRTASGQEVDFVIETPKRLLPMEVKAAARVAPSDARGLETFLDEYKGTVDEALLLYAGSEAFPITRRVLAVPWCAYPDPELPWPPQSRRPSRCPRTSRATSRRLNNNGSIVHLRCHEVLGREPRSESRPIARNGDSAIKRSSGMAMAPSVGAPVAQAVSP